MTMSFNPFTSKTVWTGLGAIVGGAAMIYLGQPIGGVQTILGGFAAIFLRQAVAANGIGK